MPHGTRLEYKLEVVDSFGNHLVEDPLNPPWRRTRSAPTRSARPSGYVEPPWAVHDPRRRVGSSSRSTRRERGLRRGHHATVYLPAGFATPAPYPLLVVHDGGDYLRYAALGTVLDNLIHRGELPPMVAAFIQPGERLVEYADDRATPSSSPTELVPRSSEFAAATTRAGRCLMGASFGAVASLSPRGAHPGLFGRLLLQSGSFAVPATGCRPRPSRCGDRSAVRAGLPRRPVPVPSGCSSAAACTSR